MHPRASVPEALERLIAAQAGAISREQALAYGLSSRAIQRLVGTGQWRRLGPGVYSVGPLPPTWLCLAWAGVLLGGDTAALGGRAAWHLHGLSQKPPGQIVVLVPASSRTPACEGPWLFVRTRRALRSVGSPPRTSIEETVLDLCGEQGVSTEAVVGTVTDAVQQRRTSSERIVTALEARSRHPRRRLLQEILGDVRAGARSPLERRFLRDVERAHGLPTAGRQIIRRGTEADLLYREHALLVELDGRIGHEGSAKFRDMDRDTGALELDRLATLRYGYHAVRDEPCRVAAQVASVLRDRGWSGLVRRCPRCPQP